jgi:hypothetical protein
MPVIASTPDRLEIRRPRLWLPFVLFFALWLVILPFLPWHQTAEALFAAFALLGFFEAVALFSLGGIRIVATAENLQMHGVFWRLWCIDLDHMAIREGQVGEDIHFNAYILENDRHQRGAVAKKDFEAQSLSRLIAFLAAHGAVFVEQKPQFGREDPTP